MLSPLARAIRELYIAQYVGYDIKAHFTQRGYSPAAIYLATVELYRAGYINSIVFH